MRHQNLSLGRLERRLSNDDTERLQFRPGVNVLVGPPNTGKTKWLQTLDYLLGDPGSNPFEAAEKEGLAEKYLAAGAELIIGERHIWLERRWREPGAKAKVFVDGEAMGTKDFQQFLMETLGIPLLNFPKGNPMSGQTWPELSVRMLLRHVYRQQRFWGDIADQQPEGEQHACLLQFLGLAERIYTKEYGQLVDLKMKVERLKARREQYGRTLDDLARDILTDVEVSVSANATTVGAAETRLAAEIDALRQRRTEVLASARNHALSPEDRGHVVRLGEERATVLVALEELRRKAKATSNRLDDLRRYRTDVVDEVDRMARAEDAGAILGDLKVTHCPACDQSITNTTGDNGHCFLCHQIIIEPTLIEGLGAVRLRFERDRLAGDAKEVEDLTNILERDAKRIGGEIVAAEERLRMLGNELAPAREAVASLVDESMSAIDTRLGELNERQRQLGRVLAALEVGQELTTRIVAIERDIEPLQATVDELIHRTDFDAAAAQIEDGMNAYLQAINTLRPDVWRHSSVAIDVSRSNFAMRVGSRRWRAALGGTDTLYFLMAYQYGLLTLSDKQGCHYPGLSIIDVPGEFSGEAVQDKENFIVKPFIDLLAKDEYAGAQLIITGASFTGLENVERLHLRSVYVA